MNLALVRLREREKKIQGVEKRVADAVTASGKSNIFDLTALKISAIVEEVIDGQSSLRSKKGIEMKIVKLL